MYVHPTKMSLHKRSILVLCTLGPLMKLPLPGPRKGWLNMNWATWVFSPPWSPRTLDGNPCVSTAEWKSWKTVEALLLVLHFKNIIFLE